MSIWVLIISFMVFSLAWATSISELKEKANKGILSEEEYEEYIKYGLCKPLKENFWIERERGWLFGEYCSKKYLTRNYNKKNQIQKEKERQNSEQIIGMTGTGGIIVKFKINRKRVRDPEYLSKLDAKKLRYLYQELLDEVTTNPSIENIKDFLYVQDYFQRKSLQVARVWQEAILSDKNLSPVGRFKTSSVEEKILAKELKKDRDMFFVKNRDKLGLYVFVRSDCPYCKQFIRILEEIYLRRKILIRLASQDRCPQTVFKCDLVPELFDRFGIYTVPTTMLVAQVGENRYKYKIISVGINSVSEIEERIVYYFKYLKTGKHIDDRTIIWGTK